MIPSIASLAMAYVKSLPFLLIYASRACVSASIPVSAAICAGSVAGSDGSRIATSGKILTDLIALLNFSSSNVITLTFVTSDAVPDVDGTATNFVLNSSSSRLVLKTLSKFTSGCS